MYRRTSRPTQESQPVAFHWSCKCHETIINCLIVINSDTCQAKAVKNVMFSRAFPLLACPGGYRGQFHCDGVDWQGVPWSHCHVELRFEQKVEVHMKQLTSGHQNWNGFALRIILWKQIWWNYEIIWNPLNGLLLFFSEMRRSINKQLSHGVGFFILLGAPSCSTEVFDLARCPNLVLHLHQLLGDLGAPGCWPTARRSVASGVGAQQDVMQTHAVIHRGCQVLWRKSVYHCLSGF